MRSAASQGPRAASHGAALHGARQNRLPVFAEGTAAMKIVASRRQSYHGAASPGAVHTTPQVFGVGTAVMRRIASGRAACQAGTSRPIAVDPIGNVSSFPLFFCPQNPKIVSPFIWFYSIPEQLRILGGFGQC